MVAVLKFKNINLFHNVEININKVWIYNRMIDPKQHQFTTAKTVAGFQRGDGDSSWTEQHRVDFVEIHVHAFEHFGKRAAVIA